MLKPGKRKNPKRDQSNEVGGERSIFHFVGYAIFLIHQPKIFNQFSTVPSEDFLLLNVCVSLSTVDEIDWQHN